MALFKKKVPEVIDLRDHVLAKQQQSPFAFGFPTRCPSCHGRGYLDHIDPFRRIQFEHCKACGLKWETAEDEIYSLNP